MPGESHTEEHDRPPTSTDPGQPPLERIRRARMLRRIFFTALCGLLLLGLLGVFGPRTSEVSAQGGPYELTVTYANVSRPGLASVWSVEIRRQGGFDGPVTLATTSDYFDIFDENGLDPDPSTATTDGKRTIWKFEPPDEGDTLVVSFDARIEPGVQGKSAKGTTSVLEAGQPVVSVDYRTMVTP